MADGGVADIFGAAAVGTDEKPKGKRSMLKNCDSVAAKGLDPWGISVLSDVPLDTLWKIIHKGDKYAHFYSNLAAEDAHGGAYRVGIGLSQLCQIYLVAIAELEGNNDMRRCLNPKVLEKGLEEAKILKEHMKRLNAGKDGLNQHTKEESFGNLKRRRLDPVGERTRPTAEQLEGSAKALHAWLKSGTKSNLRMLINFLGASGTLYAAAAADKTTRAWAQCADPAVTDEVVIAAVKARQPGGEAPASSAAAAVEEATGGLFD